MLENTQPDPLIFDVAQQDFQRLVIEASQTTPVIVDFWAPWCEPCKQLMPILEQAVQSHGGKVKLAKVNIDENQAIAQQLQIQSVPTVYAFYQGRPADGFAGVQPPSKITEFVNKLATLSAGFTPEQIAEVLKQADTALHTGDYDTAMALYGQVFGADSTNKQALAGLLNVYVKTGQHDTAHEMLNSLEDETKNTPEIQTVIKSLTFAEQSATATGNMATLQQAVDKNPNDHQALLDLATAQMAGGQEQQAVDNLLHSINTDRTWNDGQAREKLLEFFEIMGNTNPITLKGRRKLSTIWFT